VKIICCKSLVNVECLNFLNATLTVRVMVYHYEQSFVDMSSQFFKGIQFQRVAPRVYGACGRLVVLEHGGQLLSSYLDEPFAERAEFALQLLSMVQVFWVRIRFR